MALSDRLREAMRASKKSQSQLAKEVGVSTAAVSQWMSGKSKSLKAETAAMIEAATGFRAAWITKGTGERLVTQVANVLPATIGSQQIPVISYMQAGQWTEMTDSFDAGEADHYLLTDQSLSRSAFALSIVGDSMLPDFKPGDCVIIDPAIEPQAGDFVVAQTGEQEAIFKKYKIRAVAQFGQTIFDLVPLNDDYATISSDTTPVRIVGTMVEHRKYRKR